MLHSLTLASICNNIILQMHHSFNSKQYGLTLCSHFPILLKKKSITKIHLISRTFVYHALYTKQPSCTAIIKMLKLKFSTTQRKSYHSKSVTHHTCNINCHYIHVTQMQSMHTQHVYDHRIIVNIHVCMV